MKNLSRLRLFFLSLVSVSVLSACELPGQPEVTVVQNVELPGGDTTETVTEEPAEDTTLDNIGNATFDNSYTDPGTEGQAVEESEAASAMDELAHWSEEDLAAASAANAGKYGYESLDGNLKTVYNQMYLTVLNMAENISVDSLDPDDIQTVFKRMIIDHPEFFWVSGFTYTDYKLGDEIQAVGFTGSYTCDSATRDSRQTAIDNYVNTCLAGVGDGDDYSRIKYVYEYIIKNTEYDVAAADNQNICSVFINGRSVCQGYAKATQYLLNKLGIRAFLITGVTNDGQNHAWNAVYSDGSWYQLDTTWGDSSYKDSSETSGNSPQINYDYLLVTTDDISRTHTPDGSIQLPSCMSMTDNYYVREGAYFTSVDQAQMSTLFANARAAGRTFVTLKASNDSVYEEIKQYLITDQNIFSYLDNGGSSVSYWENTDACSISFRL